MCTKDVSVTGITFKPELFPDKRERIAYLLGHFKKQANFAFVGVRVKPMESIAITGEYGSISGEKKCILGTCVDLPPYKGFKLTVESVF